MQKISILLVFLIYFSATSMAQILVSSEHIGDLTNSEIRTEIGDVGGPYGASLYKIRYTMLNPDNQLDTLSGLVGIPLGSANDAHVVIYCHGTSSDRLDVPSERRQGYSEVLGFCSAGFAVGAPDYPGLGANSGGFHPYVNARYEALSGLYMIDMVYNIVAGAGQPLGLELFFAGYSQGGHASMALQELIEEEFSALPITACAHGSGPYSVSTVMRDLIVGDEMYLPVGFVPYFIIGQQEIYGNIYNSLDEIFRQPYIANIQSFINEDIDLVQLSINMAVTMSILHGDIKPKYLLHDSILTRVASRDTSDILVKILHDNDVYDFVTDVPTNLYYCEADEIVPYQNSIYADSVFQTDGSSNVNLIQVDPNLDHGSCGVAALPMVIDFFLGFINVDVDDWLKDHIGNIYPNPASTHLYLDVDEISAPIEYTIWSIDGKSVRSDDLMPNSTISIPIDNLSKGQYLLQLAMTSGTMWQKFVKE